MNTETIQQIEDFNWNLRHFLDVMTNYEANVNKANPTTLQLLERTLDKLGNLIENVDEIEEGRNETIIFSIDESKFDVKRSIFCRICKVWHAFCIISLFEQNVYSIENFFLLFHGFNRWILVQRVMNTLFIRLTPTIIES